MKTDQLIDVLSTNLKPVERGSLHRSLQVALGIGARVASALTFLALGVRPDLHQAEAVGFLALKLTSCLTLSQWPSPTFSEVFRAFASPRTRP